jgi:hypothetical protein
MLLGTLSSGLDLGFLPSYNAVHYYFFSAKAGYLSGVRPFPTSSPPVPPRAPTAGGRVYASYSRTSWNKNSRKFSFGSWNVVASLK